MAGYDDLGVIVTGYIGPAHLRRVASTTDGTGWRVQRLTPTELLEFVTAACDGKLLLAQEVRPVGDIACVFPAVSFLADLTADARREIGTFYEYRDRATGTARNGQPSFQSVQFIHQEDWLQARDMIAAEMIRRERL